MSQLFTYESHQIRTVTENGETWFAAVDVCKSLGISWRGNTLNAIPDGWKGMRSFRTPSSGQRGGGIQTLRFISEPAVYKLAFRSNKPEADAFTNWVASEVLPAIRKTGKFEPEQRRSRKALPTSEQLALPTPKKDKFDAYLEEVEAFRVRTQQERDRLFHAALDLVDVYKTGGALSRALFSAISDWLDQAALSPVSVSDPCLTPYAPILIVRELERKLPSVLDFLPGKKK